MNTKYWTGKLKWSDHWTNTSIGVRTILKLTLKLQI